MNLILIVVGGVVFFFMWGIITEVIGDMWAERKRRRERGE